LKQEKRANQGALSERGLAAVQQLLSTVVDRMRLPADYNTLEPDEDEEEYQQYRRLLRQILEVIYNLSDELVLNYIHTVVRQTFENLGAADFTHAELALQLINCIGDSIHGRVDCRSDNVDHALDRSLMGACGRATYSCYA